MRRVKENLNKPESKRRQINMIYEPLINDVLSERTEVFNISQ